MLPGRSPCLFSSAVDRSGHVPNPKMECQIQNARPVIPTGIGSRAAHPDATGSAGREGQVLRGDEVPGPRDYAP